MSTLLEPRQVDRPYLGRWLQETCALFMRSPVGMTTLVVLLLAVEWSARLFPALPAMVDVLYVVVMPWIWLCSAAVARKSDRPLQRTALMKLVFDRSSVVD